MMNGSAHGNSARLDEDAIVADLIGRTDVMAAYHGDPAARSVDEVLLCYPGVQAMIHHRLAHALYRLGVPLLARMLAEQAQQRARVGGSWALAQADMRNLPFAPANADVVMAGWAIGHMRGWYEDDWKAQMSAAVDEMERMAVKGGTLFIFETMSTGWPRFFASSSPRVRAKML